MQYFFPNALLRWITASKINAVQNSKGMKEEISVMHINITIFQKSNPKNSAVKNEVTYTTRAKYPSSSHSLRLS